MTHVGTDTSVDRLSLEHQPPVRGRAGVKPEIQALRAAAVGLVILYHLWPYRLTGGYIGVDVFFVISGFLITSHIVKDLTRERFSLLRFYVRRIRRLLPASLTVLLVTAVATALFLPMTYWREFGEQIASAGLYGQNWLLAGNAVDYLALSAASPVQHYWSLSIEEQFYIGWPPLLMLVAALAARRSERLRRPALALTIGAVTAGSFAWCVWYTSAHPAAAYFVTPTRIWELGAGGLLALAYRPDALPRPVRSVGLWVGLMLIAVPALLFTGDSAFPGWIAALPVTGTVLVIGVGRVTGTLSPGRLMELRPVQYLGDISYSLYLWHWPLIVLLPVILGVQLGQPLRVVVLVSSLVAAGLSRRFLERPFLERPLDLERPARARKVLGPSRVLVVAFGVMALVAAAGGSLWWSASRQLDAEQAQLSAVTADPPPCLGAASPPGDRSCGPASRVVPGPLLARGDVMLSECQQRLGRDEVISCDVGSTRSDAKHVALAGDSHAQQWLPAVAEVAERENWRVTTYLKAACPFFAAPRAYDGVGACERWNREALRRITAGGYSMALVSNANLGQDYGNIPPYGAENIGRYLSTWRSLTDGGVRVVAIEDSPMPRHAGVSDAPSCLEDHPAPSSACDLARPLGLHRDPQAVAQEQFPAARVVDMSPYYCTGQVCPAVIGGVAVYRDADHTTATFSRTLGVPLQQELRRAGVL